MKKLMSQICVLILIPLSLLIVTGCGGVSMRNINERPDDDISEAIYEAVGREKVHYHGKKTNDSDEPVIYEYLVIDYEDENVLQDMVEAANAVMEDRKTTDKIILDLMEEIPGGGTEGVTSLRTYYEGEDGYELYESFQNLYICGTDVSNMRNRSPYDKLSTYINLPDIKSLTVSKKIAQSAEEEGIDWYEIWSDLEHYRVLDW